MSTGHLFGGTWTEEKLEHLRQYLVSYLTALKNQPFHLTYVDAFAGTGYRQGQRSSSSETFQFVDDDDATSFLEGSARIALQIEKPTTFDRYVFIEQNQTHFAELQQLRNDYPDRCVEIYNEEANLWVQKFCQQDWKGQRAVIFLDPYGAQVEWQTIESIANTEAIDLWLLFPLGQAVNRMLPLDGNVPDAWVQRLNRLFGTDDWFDRFYPITQRTDLWGTTEERVKVGMDAIGAYFIERLQTVFAGVAKNPRYLYNSRNCPIFMLCFASGNQKGAEIAVRIASHILG